MSIVLYFTDAHDEPDQDKSRFEALGNLIADKKPDVIVQGGDFTSMKSLSHWDRDKRKLMEHRRYSADVESFNEAIRLIFTPLMEQQKRDRKNKTKLYKPEVKWIEGNHEFWAEQYVNYNPTLEGTVSYRNDIQLPKVRLKAFDFIPFRSLNETTVAEVGGVAFTHAVRGRTGIISSKYLVDRSLAEVFQCSVVFGHTHRNASSTAPRTKADGSLAIYRAINGGCFFEETPEYAANNNNDYWPGVLLLECKDGKVRILEEIPMDVLKNDYGND